MISPGFLRKASCGGRRALKGARAQGLEALLGHMAPEARGRVFRKHGGLLGKADKFRGRVVFSGASDHLLPCCPCRFPLSGAPGSSWWLCLAINSTILFFPRL